MKKSSQILIVALIISIFTVAAAFAEPNPSQGGRSRDKMDAIKQELNLTPEQDKLLTEVKSSHRAEMESLVQALKTRRQELKAALGKAGVTRQQIEPIASQIKALQAQMVDRRIDGILRIKQILTPEQFQKLQNAREEWRKSGHMRHSDKGF